MLFQHIGHAEFLIETESGIRIVTDPYDASCGYPVRAVGADIALISHHHHDHDAVENLTGTPRMIDTNGNCTPEQGVRITAIPAWHDDAEGRKRGSTLLFLIEAEGLRIAHLGDLGCALNTEQLAALGEIDVLMVPIGGFFTIDAAQAMKTVKQLNAKIVLPMHYKTPFNEGWPISGPEAFISLFAPEEVRSGAEVLRVTVEDLDCHPRCILFAQ